MSCCFPAFNAWLHHRSLFGIQSRVWGNDYSRKLTKSSFHWSSSTRPLSISSTFFCYLMSFNCYVLDLMDQDVAPMCATEATILLLCLLCTGEFLQSSTHFFFSFPHRVVLLLWSSKLPHCAFQSLGYRSSQAWNEEKKERKVGLCSYPWLWLVVTNNRTSITDLKETSKKVTRVQRNSCCTTIKCAIKSLIVKLTLHLFTLHSCHF